LLADDNPAFTSPTLLGTFSAVDGLGNANNFAQVFTFASTNTSHVRMEILSNNGSTLTTGITEAAFEVTVTPPPDADSDGVPDTTDNCTLIANVSQTDTDTDGHGNVCDADFNQDCAINFFDLVDFKNVFGVVSPLHDLNESGGPINFFDLVELKVVFGGTPGPSAAGLCP